MIYKSSAFCGVKQEKLRDFPSIRQKSCGLFATNGLCSLLRTRVLRQTGGILIGGCDKWMDYRPKEKWRWRRYQKNALGLSVDRGRFVRRLMSR